jgi:LacI family repressor for deo operon, udp, cdd, tsx, nupC, and nupG
VDTVSVDNFSALRLVVEHLVGLGHQRIGALHGALMCVDGAERHEAFTQALAAFDLPLDESICGVANFSPMEGYHVMQRILQGKNRPTAMFCANDQMALGACRAVAAAGLRVPDDISIVGFDDIEASLYNTPTLTTIRSPLRELGRRSVEHLMTRIRNPDRPCEQIALQAELIVRESSAPCRSSSTARPPTKKLSSTDVTPPGRSPQVPPSKVPLPGNPNLTAEGAKLPFADAPIRRSNGKRSPPSR